MNRFAQKIRNRESGVVLYGLTPPKVGTESEVIKASATRLLERVARQNIDGVILYDVQDEQTRTAVSRPFPYRASIDPSEYYREHLTGMQTPAILYQCVGKYSKSEMKHWLERVKDSDVSIVFVGMASNDQEVKMTLEEAYILKTRYADTLCLGAVMLPERHGLLGDEPQRMFYKVNNGCEFFVTQMVYDIHGAEKCLKDYKHYFESVHTECAPVIFTISPCGSLKTLEFIHWLGVNVPEDIECQFKQSDDILALSAEHCKKVIDSLSDVCESLAIPYGFNIESVAIRKSEVEAAHRLLEYISSKVLG